MIKKSASTLGDFGGSSCQHGLPLTFTGANVYPTLTIRDVIQAIKPLAKIPRPDGDSDGDCLNSPTIIRALSQEHRAQVEHAVDVLHEYTRETDGQSKRKSVNTLTRNGFPASLHEAQGDPMRNVGRVQIGEWEVDISDPNDDCNQD
jgi:hypothetical protein